MGFLRQTKAGITYRIEQQLRAARPHKPGHLRMQAAGSKMGSGASEAPPRVFEVCLAHPPHYSLHAARKSSEHGLKVSAGQTMSAGHTDRLGRPCPALQHPAASPPLCIKPSARPKPPLPTVSQAPSGMSAAAASAVLILVKEAAQCAAGLPTTASNNLQSEEGPLDSSFDLLWPAAWALSLPASQCLHGRFKLGPGRSRCAILAMHVSILLHLAAVQGSKFASEKK